MTTSTTEFWPLLHQLAEVYEKVGLTSDERLEASLTAFRELPATIRRQLLADLFRISMDLPDLYAAVVSTANQGEARNQIWPQEQVG